VSDASWQAETLLKLFGEEDGDGGTSPPKDPTLPYTLRRVAAVGCYVGGRSAVPSPPFEPAFDTEVTAREGFGVSLLPTGDVYVGGTAGGVRDGIGALWASQGGGTYIGGWRGGVKHGEAWWALPDGSLYEGTVRYGQRHGRGVYTYANGDIFVGQWFTGKKHGAGKYKCKEDGTRYTGTWSEGELTRASVTTADGTTFFSAFVNGRPAGPGAFLTASGALASGHHPVAAVAEEGEEAEPLALQWSTTSVTASELTSSSRLASKFGGGGGPPQPRRKALIVAPDYAEGGAFPPLKLQAAAQQLRELLSSRLGLDPGDITLLSAAEAADAVEAVDAAPAVYAEDGSEESPAVEAVEAKPAVVPATKEAVVTAVETMSNSLGRGDVAFLAFLCHGQRLLETDAAAEEAPNGLCMADTALGEDEMAELVSRFTSRSTHLFLLADSCFDAPFMRAPPPNFAALTAIATESEAKTAQDEGGTDSQAAEAETAETAEAAAEAETVETAGADEEKVEQSAPRYETYFEQCMTSWLAAALENIDSSTLTYGNIFEALKAAQASADKRSGLKQTPTLYTRDTSDALLTALA